MSVAQKVLKNASLLYASDIISRMSSAFIAVLIARYLGSVAYGQLNYIISLVIIAATIAEFGLGTYLVRKQTQDLAHDQHAIASAVIYVRCLIALACFGLLIVYGYLMVEDPSTRTLLWIAALGPLVSIYSLTATAILRAREEMTYEAVIKLVTASINIIVGLAILFFGWGVLGIVVLTVVLQAVTSLLFMVLNLKRHYFYFSPRMHIRTIKEVISSAFPFAMVSILVVTYFRIGSIMIESMLGQQSVGYFAAVYRLMELLLLIPLLFGASIFPAISRNLHQQTELVLHSSKQAVKLLFLVAAPMVVGGVLLAKDGILLIYGSEYEPSIAVFQILIFAIIPVYISAITSNIIAASHKPSMNMYIAAVMVAVSIGLNLYLIPILGINGAAIATVVTEFTGLIIGFIYIHRRLGQFNFIPKLLYPVVPSLIMGLVIVVFHNIFLIPMYLLVYVLMIFCFKVLDDQDRVLISKILPSSMQRVIPEFAWRKA